MRNPLRAHMAELMSRQERHSVYVGGCALTLLFTPKPHTRKSIRERRPIDRPHYILTADAKRPATPSAPLLINITFKSAQSHAWAQSFLCKNSLCLAEFLSLFSDLQLRGNIYSIFESDASTDDLRRIEYMYLDAAALFGAY